MILFFGAGQIGGSLLMRTREVDPDADVAAWDVTPVPDVNNSNDFAAADLIVVSTPLEVTLRELPAIVASGKIVLDTMSVKCAVHAAAGEAPNFVGGHPMIGSENSGAQHANGGWLQDALFVLTATDATSQAARDKAERFVRMLGARPVWRTPEAHDQQVARVSHVPQMVASALALLAEGRVESWLLQGPAFRDMTRIAASPSEMWSEILRHNTFVGEAVEELTALLHRPTLLQDAHAAKERAPVPHASVLAERVAESSTGVMLARVMQLKAAGRPIAALHVGEPQIDASPEVGRLAREAMATAPIHYTASQGLPALRERVAASARRVTGRSYGADDVIVTVGAKQALHLALASLVAPAEEVIVPTPAWVSFVELVKLCGGKPVLVAGTPKITAEQLARAVTAKTRALILNTPNNPTGAVYTREELAALVAVADKHGLWLLSDELYRTYVWTGTHVSPVSLHERALFFDGISKSHAMTGLRIGYAAGPRDVIARMRRLASHETSSAPSTSQYAAVALLDRYPDGDPALLAAVGERRRQVLTWAADHTRLASSMDGAFYAWLRAEPGTSRQLLDAHDVAVMPGEAFGAPGFMRLAYATDAATLQRGLDAINDEARSN